MTAWTRRAASATSARCLELSYGTRLAAVGWSSSWVEVVMLSGRHQFVARSAVAPHESGAAWPAPSGARLVTEAKRFLGRQYLWAGTSGFGYDCSGLVSSVYAALGTTLPRDAGAQFAKGTKVAARSSLRPGDLVFFRNAAGAIHHVGMYAGGGMMVHAPATGQAVQLSSIYGATYYREFAGGRRYVP